MDKARQERKLNNIIIRGRLLFPRNVWSFSVGHKSQLVNQRVKFAVVNILLFAMWIFVGAYKYKTASDILMVIMCVIFAVCIMYLIWGWIIKPENKSGQTL